MQKAKCFCHNSPHGLKVAAQKAESRRRPDTRTVRPEAARDRLSDRKSFTHNGVNVRGEQLTSQSATDPGSGVHDSASHIKASSILEARAPLQG